MAEEAVDRMPYEGYETSVEAAAQGIAGLLDSDEEHTEETDEQEEAEAEEEIEASVEDDEAEESDDEEEETKEAEEEPPTPQAFKVKVDGAEVEVTLDELLKGYSREADYTRKTQALAEERKTELEQYRTAREQYLGTITALQQHLQTTEPPKPDPALRETDPGKYAAQWADRQQWEADQTAAAQERTRLEAEKAEEFQRELQTRLAEEQEKLAAALPEMADKVKGPEVKKALATYATSIGFTEQDLANVYDHRLVVILDKARRFDALQAKAEPVLKKAKDAPVLKPGHRENPSPNKGKAKRVRSAESKLRQSGRAEDAAAWILEAGILDG